MDKRYQVFVSSTYVDLKEERQEVIQALLELDCIPAGMELFPAADEDQWSLIKKVIDDCDYYIVIVGGRYGSISPTGLSYTQMEYEYAVSQGKPVIGFIHKSPDEIPSSKSEQSKQGKLKLTAFRKLVQKKPCKYWSTPADLGSVVSRSLVKLIKNNPAIGWVKANQIPSEATSSEILSLKNQVAELQKLLALANAELQSGTEDLAQGDDPVVIEFGCRSGEENILEQKPYDCKTQATWNEIFAALCIYMMTETPEETMRYRFEEFLAKRAPKNVIESYHPEEAIGISVSEEDFQTIKIQFKALGLIAISSGKSGQNQSTRYWSLTPYGDVLMTKLYAKKKPSK